MYTQNTFNKSSKSINTQIVESVEVVFSVEERSASFPRRECQSSIFLAHLSFRKESDQLHYRSSSPFLPRLRHNSSAHQVTGDGVSNDPTASSPRPLSSSRRYLYCTDFPNRANCPERGCRPCSPLPAPPAADRIICLAVAVWSAVSSLWFDPPDYSCPLHSIDRQPNPT